MTAADMVLVCALELLGRDLTTFPPIRIVAGPPPGASRHAEAFVSRTDDTINLIESAPALAEARAAAAARPACAARAIFAVVASILIHEEWHLRHGRDEEGAYAAQLIALEALGYGPGSLPYHRVRRAMTAVLDAARRQGVAARR